MSTDEEKLPVVDVRIKLRGLIKRPVDGGAPDPDLVAGTHHMEWRSDGAGGLYIVKVPNEKDER